MVEWIREEQSGTVGYDDKPAWVSAVDALPEGLPWGWIIGGTVVVVIGVIAYHVWAPVLGRS